MEPLEKSTILRAGQRPAMVLYVPINVFLFECLAGVALFWALGIWAAAFLPVHLWLVIKSADDFHWVATYRATVRFTMLDWSRALPSFIRNNGLHGKGVISFTASPQKLRARDYADLY